MTIQSDPLVKSKNFIIREECIVNIPRIPLFNLAAMVCPSPIPSP